MEQQMELIRKLGEAYVRMQEKRAKLNPLILDNLRQNPEKVFTPGVLISFLKAVPMGTANALEIVYKDGICTPVFKPNPNYSYEGYTLYISYTDIMDNKYIIRKRKKEDDGDAFDIEEREPVIIYSSLKELVADGWQIDINKSLGY